MAADIATKRLYVGNLSWSVTWRELKDHMKSAGDVTRADILQTPDGRSKGCGIVEFATAEEASNAVETLNDSDLLGRPIFLREDREAEKAAESSSKRVYVGNLAYGVAWQDLKDHMREAGDVNYAEVMMMHDGRSKGCGIVEFATQEMAKNAIETMNDTVLNGRQIFVREDREQKGSGVGGPLGGSYGHHGPPPPRFGGPGGGGGGGRHNNYGNVSVYVGNLSYDTTWQDLKDHMRRVGNIDKVSSLLLLLKTWRAFVYAFV
jgi:RNA recognition motif-containing protein